jgi:hypothetical protein
LVAEAGHGDEKGLKEEKYEIEGRPWRDHCDG